MMNLEVFKGQSCLQNRWISRVLWFLSSSRNASVLIFSCLAAYLLEINGLNQLTLSGIPRKTQFFLIFIFLFLFSFLYFVCTKKKNLERAALLQVCSPPPFTLFLCSARLLFLFLVCHSFVFLHLSDLLFV